MSESGFLRRRGTVRMAAVVVAFFSLLHACSSELAPSGGSETNWVASCDDDGDCTVGSCVCGVCSKSCTASAACPGGSGPTVCVMGESSSYRAVCGDTSAVQGVCLQDCSTTGCDAGFRCEEGACVPAAVSVPEGGSPLGAAIETVTFFSEGLTSLGGASEGQLTGRCIGGTLGEDLHDESQCTIVEFPLDDNTCDCEAKGLLPPSTDVLSSARKYAASAGFCGYAGGAPCESLCGCQAPLLSGDALEACRNDDEAGLLAGYCVVAPDRGLGSLAIIEKCASNVRTVLRYFGSKRNVRIAITCAGAHTREVEVPRASGDIGDPCTPADQYRSDFSGFDVESVVVDRGTPECASNVCLVNRFQGRTDCPYGQVDPPDPAPRKCPANGTNDGVTVLVRPQLVDRPAESAVYCSCRCDGPGPGPFCQCPTDFTCEPLLDGPAPGDVAGSYCVKAGTVVDNPAELENGEKCNSQNPGPRPYGCADP